MTNKKLSYYERNRDSILKRAKEKRDSLTEEEKSIKFEYQRLYRQGVRKNSESISPEESKDKLRSYKEKYLSNEENLEKLRRYNAEYYQRNKDRIQKRRIEVKITKPDREDSES